MIMKYRWVHLSDIHFAYKDYFSNRIRDQLFKKLQQISRQDKVNFLFITGDLTDKNADYTEELYKFINDLLDLLGLDEHHFFIVPGNHDLERTQQRELIIKGIREKNNDEFIFNLDRDTIETLISSQKKYFDLNKKLKKEDYPIQKIHFIKKVDEVNIIHLNTSWLCGIDDEEGSLFIGVNELYNVLKEENISPESLNIAIGHHSFECFHKKEQEQLSSLFKDFNIDFYLSGHVHQPSIRYDCHIGTHFCSCRQMRSDSYDSGGLVIGNIDTEKGNNYIKFFVWKQKGYWAPDTDVGLQAPEGVYKINTHKFPSKESIVVIHKTMNTPIDQKKLLDDMDFFDNVPVYQYPFSNIEINTNEEWLKHKENTKSFVNNIISRLANKMVHIFPLSQIPLLIYLGYLLQDDNNNIRIYQLDEDGEWVLDSNDVNLIPLKSTFIKNNPESKKLVVVIEVSSKINDCDIDIYLNTRENSILQFTIDEPERFKVLYATQVKEIKKKFRREMEKYINYYDEIHLFCAVPAALAVEIGRCILKSMWPKVFLYNYRRNKTPRYEFAFDIN